MKNKSLLFLAVAASLGAVTTYGAVSSNVVGYTTLSLVKGDNLVANTLDNKAGNSVEAIFDGLKADSAIFRWNGHGFSAINKLDDSAGSWDDVTYALNPGEAVFVEVTAPISVVLVGEVLQGLQTVPVVNGNNFIASKIPQRGAVDTVLGLKASGDDTVFTYNGSYVAANNLDGTATGWDSADGTGPVIEVGQGFVLQTTHADTTTFTRTFTP